MNLKPLCYLGHIEDGELQEAECSDAIWVSQSVFESFVGDNEPGVATIVKIINRVDQFVVGHISHIHYQDDNDVYVPQWMVNHIHYDDTIRMERYYPSMCMSMTLLPHTSEHITAEDPQDLLRQAFEKYSCLTEGQEVELWITHPEPKKVHATITKLEPAPIACILNCDVALDLLRPLDMPPPPPPPVQEESPAIPTVSSSSAAAASPASQSSCGVGHELRVGGAPLPTNKSKRELALEAAMKRLQSIPSS